MSKQVNGLVVGAGAVLLAYMAYKGFAGTSGKAAIRPTNPGGGYTSVAPGEYLSTDQLIYGAATGQVYGGYASTDDLIKGVVYGTSTPSVIKVGYW